MFGRKRIEELETVISIQAKDLQAAKVQIVVLSAWRLECARLHEVDRGSSQDQDIASKALERYYRTGEMPGFLEPRIGVESMINRTAPVVQSFDVPSICLECGHGAKVTVMISPDGAYCTPCEQCGMRHFQMNVVTIGDVNNERS